MVLNIFLRFSVFSFILGILIFPTEVILASKNAIELSFFKVIPSLFPFFVLQTLALKIGLSDIFSKALSPLKLFKMQNISPFILGIIGGYPIGAKAVYDLYENGEMTKKNAENALAFCNNAGPAFIVGFIGTAIFKSAKIGYILLASHIFSSIIVGIIMSFTVKNSTYNKIKIRKEENFIKTFVDTIKESFLSSLMVSGFIVFSSVIVEILINFNVFSAITNAINSVVHINQDAANSFLIGLFELTTGVNYVSNINLGIEVKLIIVSMLLSFGGLSIHLQTLLFTKELSTKKYFLGKVLATLISPIICIYIYRLIPVNVIMNGKEYENNWFFIYNIVCFILFSALILLKKDSK